MKSECDLDSASKSGMTFHADSSDFCTSVKVLLTPLISSLSSCLKIEISDFNPPKCSSILSVIQVRQFFHDSFERGTIVGRFIHTAGFRISLGCRSEEFVSFW